MSLNEFKSESKKIMQNLDIFFGNYYDDIEHSTLYTDSKTSFIQKLKRLDCECLILLGCNAAHYDLIWENIAYEFSKKVTGVVVASDGTVESEELYRYLQTFKSIMDKYYYKYTDNRKNYG